MMKLQLISLILTLTVSASFVACQPSPTSTPLTCTRTDISLPCLLKYTQTVLYETPDHFSWISGASELAVAYDVTGHLEQSRALITDAVEKAKTIEDIKQRGTALSEILTAIAALSKTENTSIWIQDIAFIAADLEGRAKADINGKMIVAKAIHNDKKTAHQEALKLPQVTDVEGYAKAVTLRKIANIFAKSGDLETAREAINSITMSIDYYKSMVRSDVARHAYKAGDISTAETLLNEADPIARSLDNGYFSGAALRDIGYSYEVMQKFEISQNYFSESIKATAISDKPNEKARSTSRIATRLSDAGLSSQTPDILVQAAMFADEIKIDTMKSYSYYEISGAAAMSGQFNLAKDWLKYVPDIAMGSTSSIRNAAKRDLAWGLTRYGKTKEALEIVNSISTDREKLQALSRMIRVLKNPGMEALPRYL